MKKSLILLALLFVSCNPIGFENDIDNVIYCSDTVATMNWECGKGLEGFYQETNIPVKEGTILVRDDGTEYGFFEVTEINDCAGGPGVYYNSSAFNKTTGVASGYQNNIFAGAGSLSAGAVTVTLANGSDGNCVATSTNMILLYDPSND